MIIEGRVHLLGDNVSTDDIIAGKYKNRILDMSELTRHVLENLSPGFYERFSPGDLIAAGRNFGTGSSREMAPALLKRLGCAAVVAESFARIFYRNAFNVGLRLIEADTRGIQDGDLLRVDLEQGRIFVDEREISKKFNPSPAFMNQVLEEGGLVAHFKKHGGFEF